MDANELDTITKSKVRVGLVTCQRYRIRSTHVSQPACWYTNGSATIAACESTSTKGVWRTRARSVVDKKTEASEEVDLALLTAEVIGSDRRHLRSLAGVSRHRTDGGTRGATDDERRADDFS